MKENFPILKNGLAYLDNAATTQKPLCVINKIKSFYEEKNANPGRGVYNLSVKATEELEKARLTVASFLNANADEIFFVKNATEGFNSLAYSMQKELSSTNNIVTTIIEHHSNFVPWLELSKRTNSKFIVANEFPLEKTIPAAVDENTKIVTITAMSNVSGLSLDIKKITSEIRSKNKSAIIIVDASQAIAHKNIDVKDIDCDFLIFSGHKIYGPLGVGVVYGKKNLLEALNPSMFGGGMVLDYDDSGFKYNEVPLKFESGTLDIASISGLAEAINFISNLKDKFVVEKDLLDFTLQELKKIKNLKIIGHETDELNKNKYGPIISFTLNSIHPHDLASIADSFGVCIRAGHHCAKPYINHLGLNAVSRVSLSFYNDKKDILKLIDAIRKAKVIFDE